MILIAAVNGGNRKAFKRVGNKLNIFKMKKLDFAKIKKGDKTIGQLEFAVSRFGNGQWEIQDEERH